MNEKDKIFEVTWGKFHLKLVNYPAWGIPVILVSLVVLLCWLLR